MKFIILGGGNSSNFLPICSNSSFGMLSLGGSPIIDYLYKKILSQGFSSNDIIITVDKFYQNYSDYFYDNYRNSIPKLSISSNSINDVFAIFKAIKEWGIPSDEDIFVTSPCEFLAEDFRDILSSHKKSGASLTLINCENKICDSDYYLQFKDGKPCKISTNKDLQRGFFGRNITNSFIISSKIAQKLAQNYNSLEDFINAILSYNGSNTNIFRTDKPSFCIKNLQDFVDFGTLFSNDSFGNLKFCKNFINSKEELKLRIKNSENITAEFPIFLGENVSIYDGVCLGKNCFVENNATICKGVKLDKTYIFDGCSIGKNSFLDRTIVGSATLICENVTAKPYSVIGKNSVIHSESSIESFVKIPNGAKVFGEVDADCKNFSGKKISISDGFIVGETSSIISPIETFAIGASLTKIGKKILVSATEKDSSVALSNALFSGILSSGGNVIFVGDCSYFETSYLVKILDCDCAVHISVGAFSRFKFFDCNGFSLSKSAEKKVEDGILYRDFSRPAYNNFGKFVDFKGSPEIYYSHIKKFLWEEKLVGYKIVSKTSCGKTEALCNRIFAGLDDENGSALIYNFSSDGSNLSLFCDECGYIFHENLVLLAAFECFCNGKDVLVPINFPVAIDVLAERFSRKVYRNYTENPLAVNLVTDNLLIMILSIKRISVENLSIKEILGKLPKFASVNRFLPLDLREFKNLSKLNSTLSDAKTEGNFLVIDSKKTGKIYFSPVKGGKGILINSQSYSLEAAAELCDFYQNKLLY